MRARCTGMRELKEQGNKIGGTRNEKRKKSRFWKGILVWRWARVGHGQSLSLLPELHRAAYPRVERRSVSNVLLWLRVSLWRARERVR